jgi:ATP-dependent Clp protease ATP-binding subunit ClpB
VRIRDSAIVAAVSLSQRYIVDRFLPDKAIDLMDEAASVLRIEIDSKPTVLDRLDHKMRQIEIEREALKKETDTASKQRLQSLQKELAQLQEESHQLNARWQTEKALLETIRSSSKNIDALRGEATQAERDLNLQRVAEIKYGLIPETEKAIESAQQKLMKLQHGERLLKEEVTEEDIAAVVSRWTGVPVNKLLLTEKEKLTHLEEHLAERVVSQEHALAAVARAIRRSRAGIQDVHRPIGSFLFLGPTGVGKTEVAKTLAATLFDDEKRMIRIDMSEYMEKHAVARLIGSPPGYVGYEEGGQLTEAVRRHPYSVILLDEVEKAHPDVFNILLQVLDDGRLTDAKGRTVSFVNTVIILTSNLGGDAIQQYRDQPEQQQKMLEGLLRQTFRPEFINRLDDIVIFQPLAPADIRNIVVKHIGQLNKQLQHQHLTLVVSDAAQDHIAKAGYDETFGARPLKRYLQREVMDHIASQLLEEKIKSGDTITVDVKGNGLIVRTTK